MNRKFIITESDRIQIKSLYEQFETTDLSPELDSLNNILTQSNVEPITPDEAEELSPDCPVEIPQNKYQDKLNEIQEKIDSIDNINVLKSELKKLSLLQKQTKEPVQEQIETLVILGVTVPPVAIAIVAGTIILMIIIKIAKLIFGNKSQRSVTRITYGKTKVKQSKACKRRSKLYRKYGVDGMFM
jgi:hypothetical protein